MKKYLVKVDQEEFVVQIRLMEDGEQSNEPIPSSNVEVAKDVMPSSTVAGEKIEAPLGGTILKINVNVGDHVQLGDVIMTLEALKLENEISAPFAGKVVDIKTSVGAMVETGDTLLVMEKE